MRYFLVCFVLLLRFCLNAQDTLSICSFNIQFLGHFKERQNEILASILKNHDIVVVQEMVAAPVPGKYPDGTQYKKDDESAAFVEAMKSAGFTYWISPEDTGPTKNHTPTTASEWWIVFYKKQAVIPDTMRCYGFISSPLAKNDVYERVPYAFPFKTIKGKSNFTLVSVHLRPGNTPEDRTIRKGELDKALEWTSTQKESNKDFYLLGDCNIYGKNEFTSYETSGIKSLNSDCLSTNTKMYEAASKGEPYDHVFYHSYSNEDIVPGSFNVIDLMKELGSFSSQLTFPLIPYDHDTFRTNFSDHIPVSFKIVSGMDTDM